jgi:hypothetical protein
MAYNNRNRLQRIIEIQKITLEHTQRGVTQKWVYENVIRDKFFISWSAYNEYLRTNAKAMLKTKNQNSDQLKLGL